MTTTRYYFPVRDAFAGGTVPAPVSPAIGSSWNATTGSLTRMALVTPRGNAVNNVMPPEASIPTGIPLGHRWVRLQAVGAPLPAGLIDGTVRAVFRGIVTSSSADLFFTLTVRVVSNDGLTERGVLISALNSNLEVGTTEVNRTIGPAPLTPVTAQAGDRLVVEYGAYRSPSATLARAINNGFIGDPVAGTDHVFANGDSTAATVPWIEFDLVDPPQAPTGLVQTAASTTTVDIDWTAPAAGPVPDSYEIRINGGAPIDVGPGTATVIPGLTADTTYDVEVRSVTTIGASAWAGPLEVATNPEPSTEGYYRTTVEIGDHSWTAERGDPPGLGVALPLSFGWAVPDDALGYPAQPETATASLVLVTATAADLDDVDIDTPTRIRVWTSIDPAARPFATFVGRVADFEASPHDRGIAWRILAADYTVDLAARSVGSAEWPAETGDARAARIMAENGQTGWSTDPIGNTFEPRTGQAVSALAALVDTLTSAARYDGDEYDPPGRVILTADVDADGLLEPTPYVGHFTAAETNHIDTIDGSWVHRDSTWRRTRTMDGTWVHIEHPGGPTVYGKVTGPARPRIAVDAYDTDALADLVLASVPGYQWLSGNTLRLDLGADGVPAGYAVDWFWRDPASPPVPWAGRLVVVEDINTLPGLFNRYAGMLAAARLVLEPGGRLVVDFRLRPDVPAHSTVTPRWIDEPPAATWLDEPADAAWFDLRTIDRLDYP